MAFDVLTAVAVASVAGGGFVLYKIMSPRTCKTCRVAMRRLRYNCGKTQKLECPKCGRRIDLGIPVGRR